MSWDRLLIVVCEWIAFLFWAIHLTKSLPTKYLFLIVYLGIIAITEVANLLFWKSDSSISNQLVIQFNVPLQFVFLFYFLLQKHKKFVLIFLSFTISYLFVLILEKSKLVVNSLNFNSLSYGFGNLLLIVAIVFSISNLLREKNIIIFPKTTFFWIICGIILYYIGSFPYQNFRNFFWSKKEYYNTAYALHYTSQILNCIMYLLFAFASLWKKI